MTRVRMINNLHDALTFEVNNDVDPNYLRKILTEAVSWEIPGFPEFVVDWEIGQRWGSADKWKDSQVCEFMDGVWAVRTTEESMEVTKSNDQLTPPQTSESNYVSEPKQPATLIVEVTKMPTQEQMSEFVGLLTTYRGESLVTLKTPEGSVELRNFPTSLTADNQGSISMTLGGASVYHPKNVEIENLAEDLT